MQALRELMSSPKWWRPFAFAWVVLTAIYVTQDGASGLLAAAVTGVVLALVVLLLRRTMLRG